MAVANPFDPASDLRQCRLCSAWDPALDDHQAKCGLCRRHPPVPPADTTSRIPLAVWPETAFNDGCGEIVEDLVHVKPGDYQRVLYKLTYDKIQALTKEIRLVATQARDTVYAPGQSPPIVLAAVGITSVFGISSYKAMTSIRGSMLNGDILAKLLDDIATRRITETQAREQLLKLARDPKAPPGVRSRALRYTTPSTSSPPFLNGQPNLTQLLDAQDQTLRREFAAYYEQQAALARESLRRSTASKLLRYTVKGAVVVGSVATVAWITYEELFSKATDVADGTISGRITADGGPESKLLELAVELAAEEKTYALITETYAVHGSCNDCLYWAVEADADPAGSKGRCIASIKDTSETSASSALYRNAPRTDPFDWCASFTEYKNRVGGVLLNPLSPYYTMTCTLPETPSLLCCTATASPDTGPFDSGTQFEMQLSGYDDVTDTNYWRTIESILPTESEFGEFWLWMSQEFGQQPKYLFGPYQELYDAIAQTFLAHDSSDDEPLSMVASYNSAEYGSEFTFSVGDGTCGVQTDCCVAQIPGTLYATVSIYQNPEEPTPCPEIDDFSFSLEWNGVDAWEGTHRETYSGTCTVLWQMYFKCIYAEWVPGQRFWLSTYISNEGDGCGCIPFGSDVYWETECPVNLTEININLCDMAPSCLYTVTITE
jgi:hypothetical protein